MTCSQRSLPVAACLLAFAAGACANDPASWTPLVFDTDPHVIPAGITEVTVKGLRFEPGATLFWNGREQATTFESSTLLQVKLEPAATQASGDATLMVKNPGSYPSPSLRVTVSSPRIEFLFPSSVPPGYPAFELSVSGSGFSPTSRILWNGIPLQTTQSGNGLLVAQVQAAQVNAAGSSTVQVQTPFSCTSNPAGCAEESNLVQFDIGGVAPGLGLRVLDRPVKAMAWDSVHGLLWLIDNKNSVLEKDSVFSIDPGQRDFAISAPLPIVGIPHTLAVSDDGAFLYVASDQGTGSYVPATIARFDLPGLTKTEWTYDTTRFPGTQCPSCTSIAIDLQVAPGAPHTVAISFSSRGVVVFDDAVVRPSVVQGAFDSLTWGFDDTVLFGGRYDDWFTILSVDGAGALQATGSLYASGALHRDSFTRRIYSDDGRVFDGSGTSISRNYFVNGPAAPDGALGRVFFGTQVDSRAAVGAAAMSGQATAPPTLTLSSNMDASDVPTRLLRWGVNGLALATRNRVYVYSGIFVQ